MISAFAVATLFLVTPFSAAAQQTATSTEVAVLDLTDSEVHEHVEAYLGALCAAIRPEQWRSLGSRANPILEAIVHNASALPTQRAAALVALAALNGPNAATTMNDVATNENEPVAVRFAAVRGLASLTAEAELEPTLRPFLERAGDARVRAVAAEQLGLRSHGHACLAVRQQLVRESAKTQPLFERAAVQCKTQ